ncbi:MAG TPA: HPF/RaiA family ribosome-associated protein [Kofleriaceae bacterium]|nr:HPF/RaiA family ribosome-associated protein [Kofleriaceae bacterium]
MEIRTEIAFHGIERSEAVEALVRRWVERCRQADDQIERCEVVLQQPHRHRLHGRAFHVTILLGLRGRVVAVSHVGGTDIYLAVADAFRAARRQAGATIDRRRPYDRRTAPRW